MESLSWNLSTFEEEKSLPPPTKAGFSQQLKF